MLTMATVIEMCEMLRSGTYEIKEGFVPTVIIKIDHIMCEDEIEITSGWTMFDELMCLLQSDSDSYIEDWTIGEYVFKDYIVEVEMI